MGSEVIWRRLGYMLSPQLDIYKYIAPLVGGQRVIDIGFGTGFGTLQLLRHTSHVTGVEFDREAVDFAQAALPGIDWEWGDISRGVGWLGHEWFDAAILIEVLEHVEDWQVALTNVVDLLKPGGRLFISARNANADLRKNDLHEREWTAGELVRALSQYFKAVELYDYKLETPQEEGTRQTPLVAVAWKGKENAEDE